LRRVGLAGRLVLALRFLRSPRRLLVVGVRAGVRRLVVLGRRPRVRRLLRSRGKCGSRKQALAGLSPLSAKLS
jgi:hypothetical protein